jgi:hypothetical protein
MGEKSGKKASNKTVIDTALERFNLAMSADSENTELALEDMQFRAGDQWPEEVRQQRKLDARPILTINKIPQNIHQLTNNQRQNRPTIKVSPYDDASDVETARVYQGLIRNIENNSNADTAYDQAFDSAVTGGRGFFRIITDYCDPYSFDQEPVIKSIQNPFSVLLDPSYKEPDGCDANWGFVFDDISMDEFKELYPDAECCREGFMSDTLSSDWRSGDKVRVAEYFEKNQKEDLLVSLPDGSAALKSDIDEMDDDKLEEMGLDKEIIEKIINTKGATRKTMVPVINWYKINGEEILEETTWPGSFIPIIPVHGEELIVDGKRVFEGIVRHAKDPQRMYNYWATAETEAIALAPKAPFIGAEGQFEGHEEKWETANTKSHAYLEYNPTSRDGKPMPAPQRNFGEAGVQAITQARMLASDDLKTTTGIYDASLGNRSNESSGIAINRRAQQAQTGNFHFIDNLTRSIRHAGRILVEIIPVLYDTEITVRIIGADEEQEIVAVNKVFKDEKGVTRKYSLDQGRYDVQVSTGPSYASKRQESLDSILQFVQSYPQAAQFAGDLIAKNMDWDGAEEIAERFKKTIPPHLLAENESALPPEVQAQLDQSGQMVQQLQAQIEELQGEKQLKLTELEAEKQMKLIELESKERLELAKLETQMRIKSAELEVRDRATPLELAPLNKQAEEMDDRQELLGDELPISEDEISELLEKELPTGGMSPGLSGQEPPREDF